MKNVIRIVCAVALVLGATAVFADTVEADHRVQWLTSVTEGYYNDSANWTGGVVPSNGIDGCYGYINFQANDVTIKAPPGGLEEDSGSIFLGTGSGTHTLTIDTRGTFWAKKNVKSVNDWWGTPFAQNLTGSHIFNFEGLAQNHAATPSIWRFDDALFTWKSSGTTQQDFDLWSGTLSFDKHLYLGSNGGKVNFYIHPEAKLDSAGIFYQRGNATTHTWFLGGEHSVYEITLKDVNAGPGRTWMHITNDAVVVVKNVLHIGRKSSGSDKIGKSHGILDVSDDARLVVTNGVHLGSGSADTNYDLRNQGDLELRDRAVMNANSYLYIGWTQASTGIVTVADNATLTTAGNCYLGLSSNSWGRLSLSGHSSTTVGGVLGIAMQKGPTAYGEVVVDDDATLSLSPSVGNWMCMGSHSAAGSVARFTAKGRSRVTASSASSLEMGYGFDADIEFSVTDDAVVTFPGGYVTNKVPVGGRSVVSISSNGVLAVRGVRGGVPGTGDACMQFVADGGTLKVSGTSTPPAPFICGCASATIGARGFTFDSAGFNVVFDQAFTAATGVSDATLTKTGAGVLTVGRNSSHPKTRVAQGALAFGAGVTHFGDELEVASGARLVLADTSASISADDLSFAGTLQVVVPDDYATNVEHSIFMISGGLTQEQVSRIAVANPEAGKAYALTLDGDGQTVKLVVSAAAGGAKTWNGGAVGSWNADANWDPTGVPTHNDDVTIGRAAAIMVSEQSAAATISSPAANVTIAGGSPLYIATGVDVAEGGTLTASAPVRNATGTIAKGGKGTFNLAGDNTATFTGDWRLERGVTEYKSAAALGADTSSATGISISNCTFRYSGAATEIERPWRLIGEYPSVFDIAGDLTFNNFKVSNVQGDGGFVKLGAGTLTLNVPSGTSTISWWKSATRKGNSDIGGIYATNCGETSGWDGLAQMTVLEGRLAIIGQGKTVTTVKQEHHGGIGGSGYVASVPPELYLKDVAITLGSGSGFHLLMGQQMAAGSAAPQLILDNANATCNGLYVGYNKVNGNADVMRPVLAVTNGTLNITWNCTIPNDVGGIEPIVRIGAGGVLSRDAYSAAGGITFTRQIDTRVEDGGQIYVTSPQNLYFGGTASGDLVFACGGGMKVHRFLGLNASTKAELVLDGGYAQFTLNDGISTMKNPSQCGIRADAGGGELIAASGVTHALAIPLRGGHIVKRGAGTIVFTNDLSVTMSNNLPVYSPLGSSTVKIANTGGLEIAEGTIRCVAGTTDAASRFSGVGTLSGEFDAFTLAVEPGATDALTFADLTATRVTVDFGRAAGETIRVRDMPETVVAKVANEAAFRAISWKGVNCGDGIVSEFRYDAAAGVVRARFRSTGVVIIFR